MAFMQPEYTCEPFLVGDDSNGERQTCPMWVWCSLLSRDPAAAYDPGVQAKAIERFAIDGKLADSTCEVIIGKWWARLQAPGYMDATEWMGPFDSERDARAAIVEAYDVDPDTGDSLDCMGDE